ncbi:MAG: glycosyltransferase [Planctomycetota bacterium]
MRLSVIIPVHNGGDQLRRCIDALFTSEAHVDEILIADDASTDGVPESLAEQHGTRVRLVQGQPGPTGPAGARNRAAAQATGDVLVFIDADVAVHPAAIGRLTQSFHTDGSVDAAFGSYDDRPDWPTPVSRYANLRHHYVHQHAAPDAETFWSGFGAVRKSVFAEAGGFRESFTEPAIEDIDFGMRLAQRGFSIKMIPSAEVTHLKRWTLRSHLKSDLLRRAVPWSRAIADRGRLPSSLNASWHERACAAAAVLSCASVVPAVFVQWLWVGTAMLLLFWMSLNAGFLRVLARHGVPTLLVGTALHYCYHVYSTVILATFLTFRNRARSGRVASARTRLLGRITAWGLAAVLLVGAIGAGIGGLSDPAWLQATIATHAKSHLSEALGPRIGVIQTRATVVAVGYALLAACLVGWGPRLATGVLVETRSSLAMLVCSVKMNTIHALLVLLLTLGLAVIAAMHADQVMRTDEAHSYLNYVTRPLPVALLWYSSPNNHMLHSMLMNVSGTLLGSEPWALRLPALLFGVACVPLMAVAAGRMVGERAGLLAAATLAGSTYWLETVTNARGYPIMIACMLAAIAAAPHAAKGRWRGLAIVAAASAIGAWSNAMMLYPFAMICIWIGLRGVRLSSVALTIRHTARLFLAIATTGMLVALMYSPAWVLLPEQGSAAAQVIDIQSQAARSERWHDTAASLFAVWDQTLFGTSLRAEQGLLAMTLLGVVMASIRQQRFRLWVVAVPCGFACVYTATRFATPPWWSLNFLVPFLIVALVLPIAWLTSLVRIPPWTACAALFVALAANTYTSAYPREFSRYNGERQAPAIVRALLEDAYDPERDRIYCTDGSDSILNFYFYPVKGQREFVTRFIGTLPEGGRLYMYRDIRDSLGTSRYNVLADYDVVRIQRFDRTELLTLRPDPDRLPGPDTGEPAVDTDDLPGQP